MSNNKRGVRRVNLSFCDENALDDIIGDIEKMEISDKARDVDYVSQFIEIAVKDASKEYLQLLRCAIETKLNIPSYTGPMNASAILKFYFEQKEMYFLCAFIAFMEANASKPYYIVLEEYLDYFYGFEKKDLLDMDLEHMAKLDNAFYLRSLLSCMGGTHEAHIFVAVANIISCARTCSQKRKEKKEEKREEKKIIVPRVEDVD